LIAEANRDNEFDIRIGIEANLVASSITFRGWLLIKKEYVPSRPGEFFWAVTAITPVLEVWGRIVYDVGRIER
jgi:hypothetical protein